MCVSFSFYSLQTHLVMENMAQLCCMYAENKMQMERCRQKGIFQVSRGRRLCSFACNCFCFVVKNSIHFICAFVCVCATAIGAAFRGVCSIVGGVYVDGE